MYRLYTAEHIVYRLYTADHNMYRLYTADHIGYRLYTADHSKWSILTESLIMRAMYRHIKRVNIQKVTYSVSKSDILHNMKQLVCLNNKSVWKIKRNFHNNNKVHTTREQWFLTTERLVVTGTGTVRGAVTYLCPIYTCAVVVTEVLAGRTGTCRYL